MKKADQPMWTWTSWSSPRGRRIAAKYWSWRRWRSRIVLMGPAASTCVAGARGLGQAVAETAASTGDADATAG